MTSCGPGTTTGNPNSPGKTDPKSGTSIIFVARDKHSWIRNLSNTFIDSAFAGSSDIRFCFKRLRLKNDSSGSPEYDLQIGQTLIDPLKTSLTNIELQAGTYDRVEFDLEPDCHGSDKKPSVSFTNDFGSFSTTQDIKIRFEGNFQVTKGGVLELNIGPILSAIEKIKSNGEIQKSLEDAIQD